MVVRKALILDIDYIVKDNVCYARFLVKGKKKSYLLYQYDPYFYVEGIEYKEEIEKIKILKNGKIIKPKKVEIVEKLEGENKKKLLKVICFSPKDVKIIRESIKLKSYEYDIPFAKRVAIDLGVGGFSIIKYIREKNIIKEIISVKEYKGNLELVRFAFDIEVYNPLGMPREKKDPIIMISFSASNGKKGIITTKPLKDAIVCKNEKEMIEKFFEIINEIDPDIVYGYNSTNFDLPYLKARANFNKVLFRIGSRNTLRIIKKGFINGVKIRRRVHIDVFNVVRFFEILGIVNAQELTLEKVYEELTGKKKLMIKRLNIWEMWDKEKVEEIGNYCLADSLATLEIGDEILPFLIEISKLTKTLIFDSSLSTTGQLVESLLMFNAFKENMIIPYKPTAQEALEREKKPIEGAFVKIPEPGIYDKIAVLDFRGLYPSIIVSYNIDPYTIGEGEEVFLSPTGIKFKVKPIGLIPKTLEKLIDLRAKLKKKLKELKNNPQEYKKVYVRTQAIKIVSNSFYGFLGYARSRWYNRKCAESITAWGRKHIKEAMEKAEQEGFTVLYADTDSLFLLMKDKSKESVIKFVEKVNSSLPEKMELEIENFYTRGVFVSKREKEGIGAKKKYALLSEDGSIKIRGFELVRRDWSAIAKTTQYKVLETILKEGNKEKAVEIVREAIERLKSGKVALEELIIFTQLTKDPKDYDVISPELAAAKKAIEKGLPLEKGSVISYVIGKKGKSISEKAVPSDYATDYDPNYYIDHQILPAVMKILKELGYSEDYVKNRIRQKSLNSFFE